MTLYLNLCPISSRGKELLDGKFITFRCVYIDRMPSIVKRIMILVGTWSKRKARVRRHCEENPHCKEDAVLGSTCSLKHQGAIYVLTDGHQASGETR
jgi:hypothetical protein